MSVTHTASDEDYTVPTTTIEGDQQNDAIPPQPMPEYTLPVKKQKQESSPVPSAEATAAADDYLLPSEMRPEPIGANVPMAPVFEASSLKNSGYRPDSAVIEPLLGGSAIIQTSTSE